MTYQDLLNKVDHTCLNQTAKWSDIKLLCDQALSFHTASVCIPPAYVKLVKEYLKDKFKICTVIGFPNGYNTSYIKIQEAIDAINIGVDEIDMVVNINFIKDKKFSLVFDEIKSIKDAIGNKILKVIIETCLLTDEEKIKMCDIISNSGADFIKTSTGFSSSGATLDDIVLLKKYLADHVLIKAAGGISSIKTALDFINLGVDRLGTSKLISLISDLNVDLDSKINFN